MQYTFFAAVDSRSARLATCEREEQLAEDLASLVLRLVVGGIFCAQGYRKLFADRDLPFGRNGLTKMIAEKNLPSPAQLALLTAMAELACGLFVLAGLLTQLAVIPLIGIMIMAVTQFKWKLGFYGGWDWPFSVLGSSVALLLLGSGRYSIDAVLDIGKLFLA
jgi:putative oxidoreductase